VPQLPELPLTSLSNDAPPSKLRRGEIEGTTLLYEPPIIPGCTVLILTHSFPH